MHLFTEGLYELDPPVSVPKFWNCRSVPRLFLIKILNSVKSRKTDIVNSDTYYNLYYLIHYNVSTGKAWMITVAIHTPVTTALEEVGQSEPSDWPTASWSFGQHCVVKIHNSNSPLRNKITFTFREVKTQFQSSPWGGVGSYAMSTDECGHKNQSTSHAPRWHVSPRLWPSLRAKSIYKAPVLAKTPERKQI